MRIRPKTGFRMARPIFEYLLPYSMRMGHLIRGQFCGSLVFEPEVILILDWNLATEYVFSWHIRIG